MPKWSEANEYNRGYCIHRIKARCFQTAFREQKFLEIKDMMGKTIYPIEGLEDKVFSRE